MPNRNWKERKECWKEYFLGGALQKRGLSGWIAYFGVSLKAINAGDDSFPAAKGLSFGSVRVPICRDCVLAP